jgi:hypothetical protein
MMQLQLLNTLSSPEAVVEVDTTLAVEEEPVASLLRLVM